MVDHPGFLGESEQADQFLAQFRGRVEAANEARSRRGVAHCLFELLGDNCIEVLKGQLPHETIFSASTKVFNYSANLLLRNTTWTQAGRDRHVTLLQVTDGTWPVAVTSFMGLLHNLVLKRVIFDPELFRTEGALKVPVGPSLPSVTVTHLAMAITETTYVFGKETTFQISSSQGFLRV